MADGTVADAKERNQGNVFLRFGASVGLANLGDGIAVVAWAWTASLLTRDPLWIAMLPAALRVPWVLFALPSGILADRMDRKRLIVFCDLVRTVAYLAVALAIAASLPLPQPSADGVDSIALYRMLICAGFVIGCAEVARDNAAQSMLPSVVSQEELERANGLLGSLETVGNNMAGPALGSFLIALFLPLPFLAIAIALLLAGLFTASIKRSSAPRPLKSQSFHEELKEGFQFVFRHPTLRVLVLVTGFWNFFAEMAIIALVLHLQENLGAGATTYGLILAVGATGGVVGGFLVTPLLRMASPARLAQLLGFAAVPLFLAIAFATGPVTVGTAMFFFYLSGVVWNALSVSYRQRIIPDQIMGRVNSVYRLFAWGTMPLGLIASGVLVRWAEAGAERGFALTVPFIVASIGICMVATLSWRPLGKGFK
ncbi:MAG: MFS transporter [Pseudomonadota bacterium]